MRFFSKKARRNNRISIFKALKAKASVFDDSVLVRNIQIPYNLQPAYAKVLLGIMVIIAVGAGAQSVFSQFEDRDQSLGVIDTLHVYPGSVANSQWTSTEQLLSPDLDEDALYQGFDEDNSAFIDLDGSDPESESSSPDVDQSGGVTTPVSTTTPENDPALEGSETPSEVLETPVPEEVTDPVEVDEVPLPVDASPVEEVSEPEVEDTQEAVEEEPEPEAEVEEPAQSEEQSTEPVTIKKATESFFTFLGTVTELFPFMNTSEVAPAEAEQDVSPTVTQAEPEVESQEEVTPVVETEAPTEQEEVQEPSTPLEQAEVPADIDGGEQSGVVEELLDETATTTASTTPDQVDEISADPAVVDASYVEKRIILNDFSTPALQPGQFVRGMQLRMSVGAQYESSGSTTSPVLDVIYRNGSTTQSVGSILIEDEVSNALNGGYFLFALPQISEITELDGIEIEIVYKGGTEGLEGMFIDAVWLEVSVEHLDKELLYERLLRDIFRRFGEPTIYTVLNEEKDFTVEELPHFNVKYNSQRNIAIRFLRDLFGRKLAEIDDITFKHKDVGDIGVDPDVSITDDGLMNIKLDEEDKHRLRPGEYELEITLNEGGSLFTDTIMFQWGLLSINPDKTSYVLGESASISMGALSPNGNTICDANLSLYVIDPNDVLYRVPVTPSGLCNGNNVIDVPDYSAVFTPAIVGEYEMYLERIDAEGFIVAHTIDTFLVEDQMPFSLSRNGPSRIYPKAEYPMEITLSSVEDWEGALIETVPASFMLGTTSAEVINLGDTQELIWEVSLTAGESQTFTYTFDAPDISPYLYTVGTARLEGNPPVREVPQTTIVIPTATSTATSSADVPEEEGEIIMETEQTIPAGEPEQEIEAVESTQSEPEQTEVPEVSEDILPQSEIIPVAESAPMEQVVGTVYSQVLFEEHREWQIASDATGSLIVFWNSASAIPAGWTCLSCGSGTFYQRFPMGGATYNTTGGATTHTHTASAVVNTSATVNTENNGSGEIAVPTHTHLYTPTISTVSSLPAYRQFRVIQSNSAGDPASIPAGAIMMFDDPTLPSGWTRLSALDGRYPRGENSIANGGSNTHTHTITGNTTAASNLTTLNSRTGGTQVTGAADNHAHSVSSNTLSESLEPPFVEVIFATAGIATSTPTGAIAMWSDEPPAQWLDRSSNPTDPFYERFFKGATTYGTTGGATTHTPADLIGITSGAASVTDNARSGTSGNSNTHTHAIDVTGFSSASNLPPYLTVIIGKKFGPIPMYTQTKYQFFVNENALTPTDAWPIGADDLLENEPITSEDTTVQNGDVIRLRMQLSVDNSTSTAESFKMQFATTTAVCTDAVSWTDVGSATSSVAWRAYDNATPADGATLSSGVFVDSDTLQSYEESNPSVALPNVIGVDQTGEWDFVLQQNNAEANTTYCFRMVESDNTPLFAYTEFPSLVTNAAPDSPTLQKLFDNQKTASTVPTFEFTSADTEGNAVTYQIQIDNDHAFSSTLVDANSETNSTLFENLSTPADKDPFTNGETVRFNNTTSFTNGTTYYWRVRGKDPDGSNQWGSWSNTQSFTIDTGITVSTWFQTTDEQFNTNTLDRVTGVSDQAQLVVGSTTGTMWSDPISFEEGELGTAWGEFAFADTETASDLKYTIQYLDGDTWTDIPDSALSGNTAGFDTSPVSLLGVDKTLYPEIRIEANFTNSGSSPSVQNWSVAWDYLIETPSIWAPFANEKIGTTTPVFQFMTTDPQNDDLVYDIEWSTNVNFTGATVRSSASNAGFSNLDAGGDSSPFNSGDTIQFQIQSGDALTNGTTYWWRVRARDPLGDNAYSFYTDPRSFTIDTSVTVATWFQTTQSQFDNDILAGALTQSANTVTVATTSDESMIVYAEGTVTTPRYRQWDGSAWSAESSALSVGSAINWIVTKAGSTRNEYITGTLGTDSDINLQVFTNGAWGELNEVTTSASNVNMRGFDIAYEQTSGDAVVVNCDGDEDPSYHIWDGDSWTSGGSINLSSGNACGWVRLIADPISDEIIAIIRDSIGSEYSAWVWDGSSWGDEVVWGSMTDENNEGIAGAYEESGNQAVVAVSNGGNANFSWRSWNGSSWSGTTNQVIGDDFEWGSMATDVGSDNMAICYIDQDSDVGVVRWNGSGWLGQLELDTAGNANTERAIDCEFEVGGSNDGDIMVVYSDTVGTRYRAWNGASWSAEATISTITDASTIQLRRTGDNIIQVIAYDDVNDRYDYSGWNGTTWSTRQALETNASVGAVPYKEPFMMAPRNPSVSATVIGNPLIDFDDGSGPYFSSMSWNDAEPGASSITYQIEYYDGDSWELVPDLLIPGNASGNSTSPLDLSGMLPTATYNQIRPVANLLCSGSDCPTLSDWTITWAEGITVSGTARAYDQTTNLTSGTVAIAVNGVLQVGKTGTVAGGAWSIPNVNVGPDDVVTVFLSGASDSAEAVAVAVGDGVGDLTGIDLYERHLSLGSDDTSVISNVDLALYDLTNTEDVFFDVDGGNDLSVCASTGCGDAELIIKAGTTFRPGAGGNVQTHSFENNGTFEPSGNTIRIAGSWDNNAITTMATSTVIFTATTTTIIPDPWYDEDWLYRIPITIQSSEIPADVTDFPVYVDLSDLGGAFFSNVTADGGDIRVTAGDMVTEVPREIVAINTGTQTGEIYFQADSLSASTDTTFYIYYGNASANDYAVGATYGREAVWSNGYEAVYHMQENAGGGAPQYIDSTGNSTGTAVNMDGTNQVAGIAGNAAEFDGANESIQTTFAQTLTSSTWNLFVNADGTQGACDGLMFSRGTNVSGINLSACGDTAEIGYHWNDQASSYNWAGGPVYPQNEWFMASMVVEPSQATVYAHSAGGVTSGTNVIAHASSNINNLDFGWDSFGVARSFDGTLDEARLSSVARSQDWLSTEYNSIADPGSFYAISAEESYASSTGGTSLLVLDDADGVLDFYNVTFGETSGTAQWDIYDTLDANNVLTVAHGTLARDTYAITVGGNLVTGANGVWSGIGTTTFDGTGASTWSDASSGQNVGHVVVDGTTKVVTLGSNVRAESMTIGANDTFDLSPANYDITLYGDWNNANTFNARSGDVIFASTAGGNTITAGGDAFYNLAFSGSGAWSFTEPLLGVSNNFTVSNGTVTMPTGTTTISGSFNSTGGTFAHNNALVYFTGTGSRTITLDGDSFTNAFYNVRFTGGGSWTFADNATTTNEFRITQGTVTFPADTLTVGGDFIKTGGTFNHNNGEVVFLTADLYTIQAGGSSFNDVTIRWPGGATGSWLSPSWDYRIPIEIPASALDADLADFPVYIDMATLGDAFFADVQNTGADIRITASDGVTQMPLEIVSIDTGAQTGEMYFKANNLSASTDTTFYIYYGNSGASAYSSGSTYGSDNVWSNGYEAVYHLAGTTDSSANSRDLTAVGTPTLVAGGYDFDGDTDFLQMPTNFGIFDGSSDFTLQVDFNADAVAPSTDYTTSPVLLSLGGENNAFLTFGDGDPGDSLIFRYQGWVTPVSAPSFSTGTDYSVVLSYDASTGEMNMYRDGVLIDTNTGAITIAGGTYSSFIGGLTVAEPNRGFDGTISDVRIFSTPVEDAWVSADHANQTDPTAFYATSSVETLSNGRTFTDTNVTILNDLYIQSGLILFPSGTLSVGGSFDNNGDIAHNDGTVLFNSSDTGETIDVGNSPLFNMTFNNPTGGWTITAPATTTNNTTITSANDFTLASGQQLSVEGVFTNALGGTNTTWTGSTLSLENGSYSINTKVNPGDVYDTLIINQDTDVKMWNSSANTISVDPLGSLYSQDNAGIDGDLYIYGSYPRTSGVEHWSYAVDFDGTSLVGSERQANVRFANTSSAILSNSTLSIVGSPSASTTIANQGSGTYGVNVTAGTTTASYYAFEDLGLNGLSLLGGVHVDGLSNGAFYPATASGSGLRVADATITANPGLQIFDVEFSTTSAISAFNVRQTGASTTSFWWFRDSHGNLDGEAFDNDTGDPGTIRWDDSSLVFSVSGTVFADDGVTPLLGGTCDGVSTPVRIMVNGVTSYSGSCSPIDGSFSIPNVVAIGDPTLTVYLDGAVGGERAVALTKTPTADITDLDLYVDRVIVRHEDTSPMTIEDMAVYDVNDDPDVRFITATGTVNTLTTLPDTELFVWPDTTFAPGGTVTLQSGGSGASYDGSLVVGTNALFMASATTTYSVGGSFTLQSGAVFDSASSTVVMTATTTGKTLTSAVGESIDFHELVFTGVGGGWNINGAITATADIEIATGTVTGTGDITLYDGSLFGDGLLSMGGGSTTIAHNNTLGGVQGWAFYDLTVGDGVTVGTTTPASNATTTVGGVFTIATGHFFSAGSGVLQFTGSGDVFEEDGTFLEDTGTVRYAGTLGADVLSTTYHNLHIGASAGSATFTASGLGIIVANDLVVGGGAGSTFDLDAVDPALLVSGDVSILSSGVLEASAVDSFTIEGSWNNDGTFTSNNGTLTFASDDGAVISAGNSSFGTVLLSASGSYTLDEHATSTGSFTIGSTTTAFTLNSGQSLAVGGSFINELGGSATTWTGSTLRLISGTNYTVNAKDVSDTYEILEVNANTDVRLWNSSAVTHTVDSSSSLYSQDHADVDGDLVIFGQYPGNGGTDHWSYAVDFDGTSLVGSERQANVRFATNADAFYTNGGLSVQGTASASTTVAHVGSGPYTVTLGGTASTSWQYYALEEMDAEGLVLTGTLDVNGLSYGSFTVSQNGGSGMTVDGTVLDANPAMNFTNNTFATTTGVSGFNVTATGTSVSSWRFTNHGGSIDGEAYDNDPDGDPGYIVWDDSTASITISGNVYSDEGSTVSTVCDGSTNNILVRVAGLTTYTSSCNASTGQFSVSGVTFSPGDSIVAYIDGETQNGATVTKDPISNVNNLHIYENRVIVRHEGTDPLTIADMSVWDSSDEVGDIPFTALDSSPDTLTLPANTKLLVWNGKEFEPGGNITLAGAGAGANYDGTLEVRAGGILTFAGAQQHSIGGSFILGAGATFDAGLSTTTFTTTGSARTIDINEEGFHSMAFTGSGSWTVTDPTLSAHTIAQTNGSLTFPTGTTTLSGSLNATGGSFAINGSPLVFTATGGTNIVRTDGSDIADIRFTGVGGVWSMTDTNATTTGSMIIEAGSVTLPSGILTIGESFRNEGGSFTHNTSLVRMISAGVETLLASSSDLYGLHFEGAGSLVFEDEDLSLLDDLAIRNGDVTLASGTVAVGGSFDANTGTFAHASGTILFNSSDAGETIDPGVSPFYNAVFAGAGGGWTVIASATTTNNLSLTLGSSYTQQSGTTLYVGNVFSNTLGGSATTWTGSTLILDAGVPYSINTKLAGGDVYDTLIIGQDTDIRSWNSSATVTTVDPSASLYSQDHGATNGALNIYGDFHISTTTEYWSYATDFDGTALTGTERAVTVSIASSATTTVDGGSLQMIGTSGNSTTIQNQGSGTYAFEVNAGTLNGLYYAFRNLNADGLVLSNTPTITSLSQGDFELAVDGGNLITLSSTTLDANASKVLTGNRFATTTAITGVNVALVGTTSNAWTFVAHTGNLSGEDFDEDGIDACGSLRWSDSSCLLTQQTHYRWRHDDGGVGAPDAEWYNASWDSRQRVRLVNDDATTYTNAVVKLSVSYDSDMQVNFNDLRFTDESGTALVPHFIERYSASTEADVWVQVPSLSAEDTTTLFMYYNNASATSSSDSEATFITADDFEDGDIAEYSGDTGLFNVDSSFAYGGTYGLDATGNESDRADDGIGRTDVTVSQGQIIRYMQYIDTSAGSGDEVCTLFGVQSPVTDNNNYGVCLEQVSGTDRMSIARDIESTDVFGSSVSQLASTPVTYTTGWYEVEIDWQTNDDIDVTLSKDGSLVASVSTNDGTYTSGGIGFTFWFQNGGWDNYTARPRVENEPTVYFGAKQSDGGASWASALDSSASFTPNDIARLRLAVENTGLDITNQTFDIEYAVKGAAPSCEAVSAGSYAQVPVQSSCGTSALCMADSSFVTDTEDVTDLLFDTEGAFTLGKVVEDPSNTTASIDIDQDAYTELEYALALTVNASAPAYCLRVSDAGDDLDTYLSVAELEIRFDPTVTNVSLNGGNDITLSPGATTTVYATGTATDLNGYADLVSATTTMYRSGAGGLCSPDNNNCYIAGGAPQCTFTNCSGNSCTVSCSADFYYHADATDVTPYEGEEWLAYMEVSDQAGGMDFDSAIGVELISLRALSVENSINYGALEVASTTGSYNPTTTVQNIGNNAIDVEIEGTDLTDGGSSVIPASEQIFATTSFNYAACTTCAVLSSTTAVSLEVDLTKPTSDITPVTDVVYWGIAIPFGVASNPHSGTNIFYAVGETP